MPKSIAVSLPTHRTSLLLSCLAVAAIGAPRSVHAQETTSAVAASALVIPEGNVTEGEASIASIGLRRGITEVEGVRFIHPVDVLSPAETTEDLQFGLEELEKRGASLFVRVADRLPDRGGLRHELACEAAGALTRDLERLARDLSTSATGDSAAPCRSGVGDRGDGAV